jgi:hypothetical protein
MALIAQWLQVAIVIAACLLQWSDVVYLVNV